VTLRRQQAEAIISARTKIVTGAVSMVERALNELSAKQVVAPDDERMAAMVSNLMTVLCAEADVQPGPTPARCTTDPVLRRNEP